MRYQFKKKLKNKHAKTTDMAQIRRFRKRRKTKYSLFNKWNNTKNHV